MDRRNFLRTLIGGVAAGAAVRTFPFRVYSFPSEVVSSPALAFINASRNRVDILEMKYWGMNYFQDDGSLGPWLNLDRSRLIMTKVDQIHSEITLGVAR